MKKVISVRTDTPLHFLKDLSLENKKNALDVLEAFCGIIRRDINKNEEN